MERKNDETLDLLLSKILNGSASSKEIEYFADWIKDFNNERYFEQFKQMWHVAQDVKVSDKQLDQSLLSFLSYIRASRRKQLFRKRLLYAISSAATILLLFGLYTLTGKYDFIKNDSEVSFADLKHCSDPIKVELSDGSVVNPLTKNGSGINLNPANKREISYFKAKAVQSTKSDSIKYNSVSIPAGERFAIILSDGTKVYLNSNSYIRYPVSFSGDTRSVTLVGRAYFDVSKSKIPFVVTTSDMKVEVLGTSFDVESTKNGKSSSVILVEGSVKVLADGQSKIISPNEKLSINRQRRDISVSSVDAKTLTMWKDGILVVKEMSFDEMIESLCSWYGVEIIDRSSIPESEKFNGRFDRENIESAIKTISLSAKVSYRIENGNLIIEDVKE